MRAAATTAARAFEGAAATTCKGACSVMAMCRNGLVRAPTTMMETSTVAKVVTWKVNAGETSVKSVSKQGHKVISEWVCSHTSKPML